jgi:tetratricopeptide (TPR) repeat protein
MDILQELKWREKMPATLTNMAIVQFNLGNNQKAIDNFLLAIEILKELEDDSGLATVYGNIANLYSFTGELEKALAYQEKSVEIRKTLNDPLGMAYSYSGMGILNFQLKKYQLSNEYGNKSIELAKSIKNLELLKENYWLLYLNDSATNDFKSAFENHKIYVAYRDSILNDENNKKITEQKIQYGYDKKTLADSLEHAKQKEIQDAEIAKQEAELDAKKFQQIILFGGLIIVFVFAGIMYSRFKVTRKQKSIIELQKQEVEEQKELVEEKQKEIVDSINYAKRIQYALLAHEEVMQKYLPETFCFIQAQRYRKRRFLLVYSCKR